MLVVFVVVVEVVVAGAAVVVAVVVTVVVAQVVAQVVALVVALAMAIVVHVVALRGPFPKPRDWPEEEDPPHCLLRINFPISYANCAEGFVQLLQADAQEENVRVRRGYAM